MSTQDVLRWCEEDMRFVFIYNKVVSEIIGKKFEKSNLLKLFETVEDNIKLKNSALIKCNFPHTSLTYVIFEIKNDIVTRCEWH